MSQADLAENRETDGTVLVVDDSPMVLRWLKRCLETRRRRVVTCSTAHEALAKVAEGDFNAVVTDISMPEMSGIDVLQRIRRIDPDLPVILLTGVPSIDTAATAIEYGAFMYLLKPVSPELLAITIERAFQSCATARRRREQMASLGVAEETTELSSLELEFERSLSALWLAHQPIVSVSGGMVAAYEALLRSDNASLDNPDAILHAAERLGVLNRLGRAVRSRAVDSLALLPESASLFVNLHPQDLMDGQLLDPTVGLSRFASRVVLEITERSALSTFDELPSRIRELRRIGYRIAIDDLGAGHSGLANIAMLEPEYIKLDMALVRNIHESKVKQKLVSSLVSLCGSMGRSIIAEGVETRAECETLVSLGCDLLQGYLFAKPDRVLPEIRWHYMSSGIVSRGPEASESNPPLDLHPGDARQVS